VQGTISILLVEHFSFEGDFAIDGDEDIHACPWFYLSNAAIITTGEHKTVPDKNTLVMIVSKIAWKQKKKNLSTELASNWAFS
jgi:hypothetical protein